MEEVILGVERDSAAVLASFSITNSHSVPQWRDLERQCEIVKNSATKFGLSAGNKALKDAKEAANNLVEALERVALILGTPCPKLVASGVSQAMNELINSIVALCKTLSSSKGTNKGYTSQVGVVWEAADRIVKLPHRTRDVFLGRLDEKTEIVSDALRELEEFDSEHSFVAKVKEALSRMNGLKSVVQEIESESQRQIIFMEVLEEQLKRLWHSIDDVSCDIQYEGEPDYTDFERALEQIAKLEKQLETMIK